MHRVLYAPRNKSDLKTFGKFSEDIQLTCPEIYLLGLFNFLLKYSSTPTQFIISESQWIRLNEICEARSILPPIIEPRQSKSTAHVAHLRY